MKIKQNNIIDFQVHPLGFYYLVLKTGASTSRIHVYVNTNEVTQNNDWHTHEFDLRSKVLVGSLHNEIGQFSVCQDGAISEYCVEYDGDESTLRPTGNSGKIESIVSFSTGLGHEYSIRAGTIHRAIGTFFPCVTQVDMKHHGGKVLSYGLDETPFKRRKVTADEISIIYKILLNNGLLLLQSE